MTPKLEGNQRYDVWAVNLNTFLMRIMAKNKSEENAEAIINMAIARRGLEDEFFVKKSAGMFKTGDKFGD